MRQSGALVQLTRFCGKQVICAVAVWVSHTLLGTFQQTKLLTRLSRDLLERGLKLIA